MRKNDLFNLIATLTVAERKQFKERYSQERSKDSSFVKVFDVVASGTATNDKMLKFFFEKENFAAHLHKTKAYLYESILEMLAANERQKFLLPHLLQKLIYMETLIGRMLFEEALEIGKEILESTENDLSPNLLVKIYAMNLCNNIHLRRHDKIEMSSFQKLIDNFSEWAQYSHLFNEILNDYHQRGKGESFNIDSYLLSPLLQTSIKTKNNARDTTLFAIQSILDTFCSKDSFELNEKIAKLNTNHKQYSASAEVGYLNSLFNYHVASLNKNEIAIQKNTLLHMEEFVPQSIAGKTIRFTHLARLKMNQFSEEMSTKEIAILLAWLKAGLEESKALLTELEQMKIYFGMAQFYIFQKKFDTALDYLIPFLNSDIAKENRPIHSRMAALYVMICNFENKEFDQVESMLRKHKYFISTKGEFSEVETIVADFLKIAIQEKDNKTLKEWKQKLKKQIIAERSLLFQYLKFINWPS